MLDVKQEGMPVRLQGTLSIKGVPLFQKTVGGLQQKSHGQNFSSQFGKTVVAPEHLDGTFAE